MTQFQKGPFQNSMGRREVMHKNDYSVVVFFETNDPKKWNYVHKLNSFSRFLDLTYPNWLYINVYDRRTRKFMKRFRKKEIIPMFI